MFTDRGHGGRRPQGNDRGPPDFTTGNASVLNNQCPQHPMSSKTKIKCPHEYLFAYAVLMQ